MEKPFVNQKFLLEKYPGKGGWTYTSVPWKQKKTSVPFRWVRVKGSIDGHEFKNYKLMPMKSGMLFLPVKAEIRKKIGKKEGDQVHIILYPDDEPIKIPDELMQCLAQDSIARKRFLGYTEGQQKEYMDWIYAAKTEQTKVARIAQTMDRLILGKKFRDK